MPRDLFSMRVNFENTGDKMKRMFFRIFLVFINISLFSCGQSIWTQQKVVQGTIDLSDWNFSRDGPANLNGEWRFFWRKQANEISTSPVTNYVKIPDQWYNYVINGTNLPVFGYATYHIQIKHQLSNQIWGINFPDICASYNAWINGKLVAQCGQFATNEKDNAMMIHPQLVFFYCESNIIDMVIEVANFIEVASGIPDAIHIGPQNLMSADQIYKLTFEFISFGIILITAFYHMFLFIFRSKEKYNLFFSLFCFTIAAKTSFEGDKFLYILIPNFSNHIYLALWCLALCASISLIYLYFYYLFPKETNRELMIFWQFVYGIYAVIILFFPIPVFSKLISIFQFLGLPVIVCTLYIVILATKQKREGALIVLIAFIVACATGVNDLLYGLGVIRTGFFLPYGFLLFILIQSYLISAKFSQAFKRNEKMRVVLQETNKSLKESETKYRNLFEHMTSAFALHEMIYDVSGKPADYRFLEVNPTFEKITGLRGNLIREKCVKELLPDSEDSWIDIYGKVASTGESVRFQYFSQETGKYFDTYVFSPKKGQFAVVFNDITEQRKASEALRYSEAELKKAQKIARIGNWSLNLKTNSMVWSEEMYSIFGFEIQDSTKNLFKLIEDSILPDDLPILEKAYNSNFIDKRVLEFRIIRADKTIGYIWAEIGDIVYETPGQPFYISGIVQDITERQIAEKKLKSSLAEKEVLLRELYHRTKNSLNTIASFVQLQKIYTPDDTLNGILSDVVSRIQSMALVHQMLYQTKDLSKVDLSEYITNLMRQIYGTYNVTNKKIQIEYNMKKVETLIDTAIPCGLVINELITNCFRHAFPGEREGMIKIGLDKLDNHTIRVSIQDNGIGLPKDFDLTKQRSIGMLTIVNLAEKQLQGHIDFNRKNGFGCTFTFPDNLYGEII